jgi:hypothetical protein
MKREKSDGVSSARVTIRIDGDDLTVTLFNCGSVELCTTSDDRCIALHKKDLRRCLKIVRALEKFSEETLKLTDY